MLGNPDRPYLVWGYTNGLGQRIERNNPREFLDAADHMTRAMQRYRKGDADAEVPGMLEGDRAAVWALMNETRQPEAKDRHARWVAEIARGIFSFGAATVTYEEEGKGSWVERAFGVLQLAREPELAYRPEFLTSDWKLFHDALQAHRFDVMHHILPEYGICAA